ncbi:MAG: heavy-metal-associated domain-containing protein [Pirellulales bacterium]|nr:heavy-metal-associated domain-containing protein [Pirellulales bacterium]
MKLKLMTAALTACFMIVAAGEVQAETTVTLSEMHLCCWLCESGVEEAVKSVDGASVIVNREELNAVITATDDSVAQKALDAVAAAGFHGKSDHETVIQKANLGLKAGKVQRLAFTGLHNCCGGCHQAIVKAIEAIPGVKAHNTKVNQDALVVEGDFDGRALVKSLFAAGFHVELEK